MAIELPQNDPLAAYQRKVTAKRCVGKNAKCACGEKRPEALIRGSNPVICAACKRKSRGETTMDQHHFASKPNNPLTVPVPVNDHRAELTVAQYDWPPKTRENPDGSPVIAAAACIRGFVDWVVYLIKSGLLWVAEMLETMDSLLTEKWGPKWWLNTPLANWAPKAG
ncbi:MAG TPA: hypothetical protein VFJ47_15020 [Terriglobales bacterium]|nr:hypothetical protein [Terriglobales bacterium]